MREFTRQAFYDLVWSRPITHVAKDFRLSDVAIHKICRKHGIPTPPLGWWAKKHAGKPVTRTALPEAASVELDRIMIAAAHVGNEPESIATVREEARVRASGQDSGMDAVSSPVVAHSIAALRAAKASEKGLLEISGPGLIHCQIGPGSLERLKLILSRIVAAAAVQGFRLEEGARGAHFAGNHETISIGVTEVVKRVAHTLTPVEQKLQAAWDKKRERQRRGASWDFEMPPVFAQWDYVCTGQLGFEMEAVHVGIGQRPRSTFRDARIQKLENAAEDISVALAVLAVAKREERERRQDDERRRQEEKRIREQPLRDRFIAERRREKLGEVLAEYADLDRLRRLLDGLHTNDSDQMPPRVSNFLVWARAELVSREAALSDAGLDEQFEDARLFGTDDDHSFKSPHWY
ncbi:hypothetical protein [Sphingomonas prati]|uniref:Uncharacterized protein n=1 Tax=Sphingomonas prati TaxID=1843237 RepID=A0A7W9F2K4_9SPHN|nr:hypothetical protein [Sphingomonas prati]MBB5730607.1 hypothetical protein [Sphingomonas prati]GGE95322.1 hypothetical protein GCM10011404_30580 [Sphingomonas prati]